MKVKELIERLEGMNPDSEIILDGISDKNGYWMTNQIVSVRTDKETGNTVLDGEYNF